MQTHSCHQGIYQLNRANYQGQESLKSSIGRAEL